MRGTNAITRLVVALWCCAVSTSAAAAAAAVDVAVDVEGTAAASATATAQGNCQDDTCFLLNKRTITRPHPSLVPLHSRTQACAAKFVSLSARTLDMYWDDGKQGVPQGPLVAGAITTTNSYETHVFYFTAAGDTKEVARVTMEAGKTVYKLIYKAI
jgi:hypothetical protein